MVFAPQNWKERLNAAGKSIEERAQGVAQGLAQQVSNQANISVDGVISAVEGAASELTGATVDLGSSLNGLTGKSIGDTVSGVANGLANGIKNEISSQLQSTFGGFLGGLFGGQQGNSLDQFASYNYEFTLGCLNAFEVNFPDFTYRNREPFVTILRSSGGQTRGSRIIYETGGKTEYFIDDIEINSTVTPNGATRLTNATSFSLSITEPYSMGNFLQALQVAALSSGHKNYIEAPYCLIVQFKGWDDFGRPINIPNTRRVWPIKFNQITFEVTEGGSVYKCTGTPYNEIGFTDQTQGTHTDTQFQGRSVAEMLQSGAESLTTILNNRELEKVEAGQKKIGNQYVIMFPVDDSSASEALLTSPENNDGATTDSSNAAGSEGMRELTDEQKQKLYESVTGIQNGEVPADFDAELQKILGVVVRRSEYGEQIRDYAEKEENINEIGRSLMCKTNLDGGTQPMATPNLSEDENQPGKVNRCQVNRSPDLRAMAASPGKKVQDLIEQTVLASEYARSVTTAEPDENGMVPWFRIEVQTYIVPGSEQTDKSGEPARIFVYRVIPYKVHRSNFQSPTQASPGIQNLTKQAAKEYNYIYTGKNKDIIDFDIRYDLAFFTSIAGDVGQLTGNNKQGAASEMAAGNNRNTPVVAEGNTEALANGKTKDEVPKNNKMDLGGINLLPENIVAMNFNEALINSSVDLINVDLTIHGDPYYVADSGMGNYNSPGLGGSLNFLSDGSINYQQSEVHILINFRTPLDYGPDGYMEFPGLGSVPVKQFSGLYKVLYCRNNFKGGEFTQTLNLIRIRNQDINPETAATQQGLAVGLGTGENQIAETPNVDKTGGGESQGGTGGQSTAQPAPTKTAPSTTSAPLTPTQVALRRQAADYEIDRNPLQNSGTPQPSFSSFGSFLRGD